MDSVRLAPPLARLSAWPIIAAACVALLVIGVGLTREFGGAAATDFVGEAEIARAILLESIGGEVAIGAAADTAALTAPPRDLFAPAAPEPSSRPPRAVRPRRSRPRLPGLSAVFIDGDVRQAVLGDRLVSERETVGGYRVQAIDPHGVLLEHAGVTYRLDLWEKP